MASYGICKETAANEFAKLEREAKESRAPAKAAANVKNATAWQATKKTKEELMESKKQTVVYKRMYQIAKEQQVGSNSSLKSQDADSIETLIHVLPEAVLWYAW